MPGNSGYEFLNGVVFRLVRRPAPPDKVSLARYRIGLAMFLLTIPRALGGGGLLDEKSRHLELIVTP